MQHRLLCTASALVFAAIVASVAEPAMARDEAFEHYGTTAGTTAAPVIITLPATGTRQLANGFTVDADGVVKNANGVVVAILSSDGNIYNPDGKTTSPGLHQMVSDIFTGVAPRATAPVTAGKAPSTTGKVNIYAQKNGYVAEKDVDVREIYTGGVENRLNGTFTNADINEFVRGNLKDPAKIVTAMKQYNVDLDQVKAATGYTRQEMIDYINHSGNAELKAMLESSEFGKLTPPLAPPSIFTFREAPTNKCSAGTIVTTGTVGNEQAAILNCIAQYKMDYKQWEQERDIAYNAFMGKLPDGKL